MKKLIIAEKPSVASDIAKVLKAKKVDDYYENDAYVVSSALGHLVELNMPADIDKKYARWTLSNLPIIPETFKLKPIDKTKAKLQGLKKLLARKDLDGVINACDAGREGELIFTYIYEIAKCKLPRQRLWVSSMTPAAISEAFNNLRSQAEMESLPQRIGLARWNKQYTRNNQQNVRSAREKPCQRRARSNPYSFDDCRKRA